MSDRVFARRGLCAAAAEWVEDEIATVARRSNNAFRHSSRLALGVNDDERATRAIRGIEGKWLTYR
jgi:hypothetical protein